MLKAKEAILDLRFKGKLNQNVSVVFNQVSLGQRQAFTDLISKISLPHKDNLDWWVQGPASRNTFASPLFHNYCLLFLIHHLIKEGDFSYKKLLVDSELLREIIEKILSSHEIKNCVVSYETRLIARVAKSAKKQLMLPLLFIKKIFQLFFARLTGKVRLKPSSKPIVLIDTFIIPSHTTEKRWYGSLWESLTNEMKKEIFFVPTIVNTPLKSFYSIYKSLKLNANKFIIKEDYLRVSDLIFAFQHKKRIKNIPIDSSDSFNSDFSKLVRHDIENNSDMLTVIEALLTYRFIKRLRENKVTVRLAIDWFEGQAVDKAWNLAIKTYYPNAKRIGYRGGSSFSFYLCSYPTEIETSSGVAPSTIAVTGKGLVEDVKMFFSGLDVVVAPSFRSGHVWKADIKKADKSEFPVLVALPISISTSVRIIKKLIESFETIKLDEKKLEFIIKPHPTNPISTIKMELKKTMPEEFIFSEEKSFPRLLNQASLLVTEASSTCMEAIASGVPVIIMENDEGLTYNPLPEDMPNEIYRRISSSEQIVDAIRHYSSLTSQERNTLVAIVYKIKEEYFEPVTKEGIERLMNINQEEGGSDA